jgi:hypothetical protein
LVVVLIAILFGIAAFIIEPYRIALLIAGTVVCLYKVYCYWIVTLYIERIGTVEKDSDITLPTICSETENFSKI